jgi:hypothetical protein
MESRATKIDKNKAKIVSLQADYNNIMSTIVKIKDYDLFRVRIDEANSLLNKINDLRIKNNFLKDGLPSNGYADHHEKINIIE